jgi:hypothetical protein
MARLYLFAEGQTEQTFADTLLKPHLAHFGVYLNKPVLVLTARKKGQLYRGGGRHYVPIKEDIRRFFKQERGADVFFTTMIDLYALYADFPRREEAEAFRHDPHRRIAFLESAFGDDIGDARFVPHLQLHEFEAYLFADLDGLQLFYDEPKKIAQLRSVADACTNPELVDDGPESAPSKRIIAQFPDYEDAKSVVGPQVAELIGLQTIRDRCPHFHQWLSRLETLAGTMAV